MREQVAERDRDDRVDEASAELASLELARDRLHASDPDPVHGRDEEDAEDDAERAGELERRRTAEAEVLEVVHDRRGDGAPDGAVGRAVERGRPDHRAQQRRRPRHRLDAGQPGQWRAPVDGTVAVIER